VKGSWKQAEVDLLRHMAEVRKMTSGQIAVVLNKTRNAVMGKCQREGITLPTPPIGGPAGRIALTQERRASIVEAAKVALSMAELSAMVGFHEDTVRAILKEANVPTPARRRQRNRPRRPPTPLPPRPAPTIAPPAPARTGAIVVQHPVAGRLSCQFIEGDGRPYAMCGAEVVPKKPYCEYHCSVCYTYLRASTEAA
jgi:hypothetical protein